MQKESLQRTGKVLNFVISPKLVAWEVAEMLEDATNQELLNAWQAGNEQAASVLVRRYMLRLKALARNRLSRKLARRVDPEDIVLSAWRSFFVAAEKGRVSVSDDDELWPLLATVMMRKLSRTASAQTAARRSIHREASVAVDYVWQHALAGEPTAEQATLLADELEALLGSLPPQERRILSLKLQGNEQSAIAEMLQISERTVRRLLTRIRDHYRKLTPPDEVPSIFAKPISSPQSTSVSIRHTQQGSEQQFDGELPEVLRLPPQFTDDMFLLQQMLGQGGLGKVYRAKRKADGEIVAVKFLKKCFWRDALACRSILLESLRASELSHPSIVRHHGWGTTRGGALFLVMDWIDGENAGHWREKHRPSIEEILQCGIAIAEALESAHAVGIVHGDLTPGNVLRAHSSQFFLCDFGFARTANDTLTPLGGTPGYLAPEQISEAFGSISFRTDIYGLGGLLYGLLAGRPPYSGRDLPEILAGILTSQVPELPTATQVVYPNSLRELVRACMQKEPAQRPTALGEVISCLRSLIR